MSAGLASTTCPRNAASGTAASGRERVVGGEQHRQRFQPDQPHLEVVDRTLVDPRRTPENDVHLAEPQAIERAADATTVAAAELDVRDVGPCPIEDPRPRQAPFAQQVDDHRVLAGRAHLEPDPIVERDQLARRPEQPLAVRGKRHAARGSREQRAPDPPLQLPDVPAEGLLGNEQPRCRGREVQVLGDRDEIPEQPDVEFAADRRSVLIHAAWMLMPGCQVLDAAAVRDQGGVTTTNPKETPPMFDPGAVGTLLIGLEAVRAEQSDRPRRLATTSNRRSVRAALAAMLHNLADRLERPTTQAAPG